MESPIHEPKSDRVQEADNNGHENRLRWDPPADVFQCVVTQKRVVIRLQPALPHEEFLEVTKRAPETDDGLRDENEIDKRRLPWDIGREETLDERPTEKQQTHGAVKPEHDEA